MKDTITRNDLIRIMAQKLKVDEADLIRTMKTQLVVQSFQNETHDSKKNKSISFTTREEKAQIELLRLLISKNGDSRKNFMDTISDVEFTHPLLKKLLGYLINNKLKVDTAAIIEYFTDKYERDSIAKILFETNGEISSEQIVTDCLKILKSKPIKEKIGKVRAEIRDKELKGHDTQKELNEVLKLQKELNEL